MISFNATFPQESCGETLILEIKDENLLSDGEYIFYEWYCSNPNCDCQTCLVEVLHVDPITKKEKSITGINFTWKDDENWECSIAPGWAKSKAAKLMLSQFQRLIKLSECSQPFKKHYKIVKAKFGLHQGAQGKSKHSNIKGASRNAPCPCGSGKKYKKCCMLVGKKT